jgi:hypothetical protein
MLEFHERNGENSVGENRFCSSSKEHAFLACEAISAAQGRRREDRVPPTEFSPFRPWNFIISPQERSHLLMKCVPFLQEVSCNRCTYVGDGRGCWS